MTNRTAQQRSPFHRGWILILAMMTIGDGLATTQSIAQSAATAEHVLYSSSLWTKKSNETVGLYQIIETSNGSTITLSSDFKTKSAPDLKLVLSPHTTAQATAKNALTGGVVIGALKSNTGTQEYAIDPSIDLSAYNSVLIHCEQYTKLWSAAPLHEGRVIARADAWKKKTKKTKGAFEITQSHDGKVIRFADNFKTSKAPEPLRIVLSSHTVESAKNKNALEGGYIVAEMSVYKGAQSHMLPDDIEINAGTTLLLHCEKYTKLWSAAEITVDN